MGKINDLAGTTFNRLTVLEFVKIYNHYAYWRCLCACGNECIVRSDNLKNGAVKSCGCLLNEGNNNKHSMSGTKIYKNWSGIKKRCYNPNCKDYPNYGGRGITMFEIWMDNFQAFYDYVSTLPHFGEKGYSLDRINNDGNYEPGNLRWATKKQQANNRRSNVKVIYKGDEMTLTEAAERFGIAKTTLQHRLERGLQGNNLFAPIDETKSHRK